ncbi:MAG: Fe-S cluster assembly ATPase SufC [Candidatus Aenigmarchaeota archaeon]|nr:Fe-S cluster assembly ATPase SufC [Candidatus Aenigmarchaeota archaeon]
MSTLEIRDLHAGIEGKEILKGISLAVNQGEIHALMGPNGSGKSTLSFVLMGHPGYRIDSGEVLLDGQNVLEMSPDERAKKGLFLAFQYPQAVPGVSLVNFLRLAYNSVRRQGKDDKDTISFQDFRKRLKEKMELLRFDENFITRHLNDGFSGGEKKRCEILQMALLEPRIAVLDETDSGLDIDALKIVSDGVNTIFSQNRDIGVLIITHYNRILNYIRPNFVHVMMDGRIVKSGGEELARQLEEKGYGWVRKETTGKDL